MDKFLTLYINQVLRGEIKYRVKNNEYELKLSPGEHPYWLFCFKDKSVKCFGILKDHVDRWGLARHSGEVATPPEPKEGDRCCFIPETYKSED